MRERKSGGDKPGILLKEFALARVHHAALNLVPKVLPSAGELLLIKVISHLIWALCC